MITPNLHLRWNRASDALIELTALRPPISALRRVALALAAALSTLIPAHGQTPPGLPFTEDFDFSNLMNGPQTTADWNTVAGTLGLPSSNPLLTTFSAATVGQALPEAHRSRALALGDMDGDGDLDIVEGTNGINGIYLNMGGAFPARAAISLDNRNTRAIALGDIDLDGDLDVVTGDLNRNARVYLNAGDGASFTTMEVSKPATDTLRPSSVIIADMNGDGFPDVLIGTTQFRTSRIYFNTGDPFLPFGPDGAEGQDLGTPPAHDEETTAILAGDMDGDGDMDLVDLHGDGTGRRRNVLYLNQGDPVYFNGVSGDEIGDSVLDGLNTRGGALGDVDNDGDLDLVVANFTAGETSKVFLNNGTADPFDLVVPVSFTAPGDPDFARGVRLGDADNDGDLDIFLLVTGPEGGDAEMDPGQANRLYVNDGLGTFTLMGTIGAEAEWSSQGLLGDINGDGAVDFVTGNDTTTIPARVYLNPGTTDPAGIPAQQLQARAASVDVDGGATDINSVKVSVMPTPLGTHNEIDVWVSNDGGASGRIVTLAAPPQPALALPRPIAFAAPGSQLVWRAFLRSRSPATAGMLAVDSINIQLNTTGPSNTNPILPQVANQGVPFMLDLSASFTAGDPDGDTIFYSLRGLPVATETAPGVWTSGTGLTLDPLTGILSGTPTQDDVDASATTPMVLTYSATDGALATPDRVFELSVMDTNLDPMFTSVAVTDATRGVGYLYDVTTSDPDINDVLVITATIPQSAAGWLSLVDNGDGTAQLLGTPAATADVGPHLIQLQVTDAAMAMATQDFIITVVENPAAPVVTLNGSAAVSLVRGDAYVEEGATANDPEDGPLPVIIGGDAVDTATPGTYVVTYSATDTDGNIAQAQRTVTVTQTDTPPVIMLNGAATVTLQQGDTYVEEGATANDAEDGDLTAQIQVTVDPTPVDPDAPGIYTITYSIQDSDGNMAQVERTVVVEDTTISPTPTPTPAPTSGGGGSSGSLSVIELLGLALLALTGFVLGRRRRSLLE